jgi:hypothetical protein
VCSKGASFAEGVVFLGPLGLCSIGREVRQLQPRAHRAGAARRRGAGERAATVSEVAIDKYKTLAFVLCGALAGLSGVPLSARMADGFLMRAIAVVILGGTAISGGVGGPLRTFIGMLIVMVLDSAMNMVGVNDWFQQAIYGAILILTVALTATGPGCRSSSRIQPQVRIHSRRRPGVLAPSLCSLRRMRCSQ